MLQKYINSTQKPQFDTKPNLLCLEKISKYFTSNSMNKTGLSRYFYDFSVGHNVIDTSNIIDIHKYLM